MGVTSCDELSAQVRTVANRETLERVAPTPEFLTEEYAIQNVTPVVEAALGALPLSVKLYVASHLVHPLLVSAVNILRMMA